MEGVNSELTAGQLAVLWAGLIVGLIAAGIGLARAYRHMRARYELCFFAGPPYVWWCLLEAPTHTELSLPTAEAAKGFKERYRDALAEDPTLKLYYVSHQLLPNGVLAVVVVGTKGNPYTVKLGRWLTCSCGDNRWNRRVHPVCKHIIFTKLRVLCIPHGHTFYWCTNYTVAELRYMALHASAAHVAPAATLAAIGKGSKLVPKTADTCCELCDDKLGRGGEVCVPCHKWMCDPCIRRWKAELQEKQQPHTCPYCREPWVGSRDGNVGEVHRVDKEGNVTVQYPRAKPLPKGRRGSTSAAR